MSPAEKPNIVFILTDQMRGDCLSILGHPVVQTPNLDKLAKAGTVFSAAYTPCPSCIAARASIFTGQRPTSHGRLGYRDMVPWRYEHTLAQELADAGYQTHCVGKTHFYPQRSPLGFESLDSYECRQNLDGDYVNDYWEWLKERTDIHEMDHELGSNSWVGGESCLPEEWHNNSWVVTRGIDFLKRRDQQRPFFLNLSFHRPHPPLDPPKEYLEAYKNTEIPPAPVGDWADRYDLPVEDKSTWRGHLPDDTLADSCRSYYALISHIDAQIGRFMAYCAEQVSGPVWYIFTSDHGEMLGDHHMFRKTFAYEGSAKVPMIVTPPKGSDIAQTDAPVSLEDIMPTILDAAGVHIPETVEGQSMLPLLSQPASDVKWRDYVHGEHAACYDKSTGMQYLTDGKEKYIWYTLSGEEQLFNLVDDPDECHNLAEDPASQADLQRWRERMINELMPRKEDGLTDGKQLIAGKNLPPVRAALLDKA